MTEVQDTGDGDCTKVDTGAWDNGDNEAVYGVIDCTETTADDNEVDTGGLDITMPVIFTK